MDHRQIKTRNNKNRAFFEKDMIPVSFLGCRLKGY